ncbi:hypothetical protein M3Y99_00977000 [Aphelenchoides fujianensis]|nr:hypothetical protein M3Y99_00977000 [Aphelenchoides fujianensis]
MAAAPIENSRERRIIWFDGEMTGLEVETQRLVEVACFVDSYGSVVIGQPEGGAQGDEQLVQKDVQEERPHRAHPEERVHGEEQVEEELLAFLQKHTDKFTCPLAGNSGQHRPPIAAEHALVHEGDQLLPRLQVDLVEPKGALQLLHHRKIHGVPVGQLKTFSLFQ